MKSRFSTTLCVLFYVAFAHAQTFTQQVQQRKSNEGVVTIVQSKEITDLVNGTQQQKSSTTTVGTLQDKKVNSTTEKVTTKPVPTPQKDNTTKPQEPVVSTINKPDSSNKKEIPHKEPEKKRTEAESSEREFDIPVIDTRKKVMINSYKVNGYRVQAFAGGNSRQDRQKAENIGNKLKMAFPTEPIYVHFYSPRWICRMGNYRSYEEANKILKQVQRMGYKQACLVQGKITVQN